MTCRVIGSVRTNQEKKTVMVFRIIQLEDPAEIEGHSLEVTHAKLKIRQVREKENYNINGGSGAEGGGLSNSMVGGYGNGLSNQQMSSGNSFGNPKHDLVYKMVSGCQREEGINRDELEQQLKGKVNKQEITDSLDYLSGEGHIYSTIDDDHFKSIE